MAVCTLPRFTAILVLSLLASPALASLSSPFDEQIGRGEKRSFVLRDAELASRLGLDVTYEIRYTKWAPPEPNGKVIVYNHGLQSHRGWFNETAGRLADDGYAVYAFDRIGSGESSDGLSIENNKLESARGHVRSWRLYLATLEKIVELAAQENPQAELAVWGNSYGAKIVTAYLFEHAESLKARQVAAAIFTTPGLYANSNSMPLAFSRVRLLLAGAMARFPVPMVEQNGDNGAGWFIGPGTWFERIKKDKRSLRDATRKFWLQTRDLDKFIEGRPRGADFQVPTFYLMVRGDRLMDNEKMERHIIKHGSRGIFKYYSGGRGAHHLLFFTEDAGLAIGDVKHFLEGRVDQIDDRQVSEAR